MVDDLGKHLPVLNLAHVFSEDGWMSSSRFGCPRGLDHHFYSYITAFLLEVTAATEQHSCSENTLICLRQDQPGYINTVSQLPELTTDFPPKADK